MGRRLGQHFLRDPRVLDRIVDCIGPDPADLVLEIGPGPGTLTDRLIDRVGQVVAVERDPALAESLADRLGDRARVITGDALVTDWAVELGGGGSTHPFKVLGNIPYYISTPLVEKALSYPRVSVVVFLVQEEVAARITAEAGSKAYGGLSVGVQSYARAERLFKVKAGSFSPPPKVDSAVLRLVPLADPLVSTGLRTDFRRFVTALFSRRRKQLVGSVSHAAGLDRASTLAVLDRVDLDPTSRVEMVSPASLAELYAVTRPR